MAGADPFDVGRFVAAQGRIFDTALQELKAARKRSHWMWFIFPSCVALVTRQRSSMALALSTRHAPTLAIPFLDCGLSFAPRVF
jgi:uncharacterized protein (DUF1810 family)